MLQKRGSVGWLLDTLTAAHFKQTADLLESTRPSNDDEFVFIIYLALNQWNVVAPALADELRVQPSIVSGWAGNRLLPKSAVRQAAIKWIQEDLRYRANQIERLIENSVQSRSELSPA